MVSCVNCGGTYHICGIMLHNGSKDLKKYYSVCLDTAQKLQEKISTCS